MTSNSGSDKPSAAEILKWMKDLNDWFSVGEKIGVRFSKLSGLEDKYPLEPEKAREELVDAWLEKDTNPTWERLADAFDYAGQRALAKRIRETYNCPKKLVESRPVVLRHQPLRQRKTTPPPAGPAVSYPTPPKSPPPPPPPYRMPRKTLDCACGVHLPMIMAVKLSNRRRRRRKFLPYYSGDGPPILSVELHLKQESDDMVTRLGSFLTRLLNSFKSRSVSPDTVASFMLNLGSFLPSREQLPIFQHRAQEIESMTTLDDLIFTASDYVSFLNTGLLDLLVGELGSDEDREELEMFKTYRDSFCKRPVFHTPPYMYGYLRLRTEGLVVLRVDKRWITDSNCSISVLKNLLEKLANVFQVLPHTPFFCRMDMIYGREPSKKSLELVLRMPPHVMEELFPLSLEDEKALMDIGVISFHTYLYCFPPRKEAKRESGKTETKVSAAQSKKKKKKNTRVSGNLRTEESLSSGLKQCCQYHSEMRCQRNQSLEVVTGADMGYDGDSDSSSEETAPLEAIPSIAVETSYQKRLMWRLANSNF